MSFLGTIAGKSAYSDAQAEETAKSFNTAMKGIGTDEKRIIRELLGHNNQQRQMVKEKYYTMYGKTLEEDLRSELKGEFEHMVVALLKPRFEFEAEAVKNATRGSGTREHILIEILCTKEGKEIQNLKAAYKSLYGKELEKDIYEEEDGPLGRIFRSLATGNRPADGAVDGALAKKEAQELYDAGEGKFGTDENDLVRILVSRSYIQLRATFDEYFKICKKDIEASVRSETGGDLEDALCAIIQSIRNRPNYFARRLEAYMHGAGTKEHDVMRVLVARSEVDLAEIKKEYKKQYNKSLFEALKSELSGDFEELVLGLVGKD